MTGDRTALTLEGWKGVCSKLSIFEIVFVIILFGRGDGRFSVCLLLSGEGSPALFCSLEILLLSLSTSLSTLCSTFLSFVFLEDFGRGIRMGRRHYSEHIAIKKATAKHGGQSQ